MSEEPKKREPQVVFICSHAETYQEAEAFVEEYVKFNYPPSAYVVYNKHCILNLVKNRVWRMEYDYNMSNLLSEFKLTPEALASLDLKSLAK